jgi:hypothetical protein
MRRNIGPNACNATNGVYRGNIVDVTSYAAVGQQRSLIYVVERDGVRSNAPPGNVVIADRRPDGEPETQSPDGAVVPTRAER